MASASIPPFSLHNSYLAIDRARGSVPCRVDLLLLAFDEVARGVETGHVRLAARIGDDIVVFAELDVKLVVSGNTLGAPYGAMLPGFAARR
jgi:hypothetical protein